MLSDRDFFVLDTKRDSEGNLEPLSIEQLFPNPQPLLLEIGCGKVNSYQAFPSCILKLICLDWKRLTNASITL
jgi:hypothetical protein